MDKSVKDIIINEFDEPFYNSLLEKHDDEDFWVKLYDVYEKEHLEESFPEEIYLIGNFLAAFNSKYKQYYSILKPAGVGGSGVVIKILNIELGIHRALKFPRPKKSKEEKKFLMDSLKDEGKLLISLTHENMISIHNLNDLEISPELKHYPFYIMDYIEHRINLRQYFENRISEGQLENISRDCARIFFEISNALALLHENQLIHFDIKPKNIFIRNGKPLLGDLGFAKKKTNDKEPTAIGFTLYYAHPDLKEGLRQGESLSFIKKLKAPNEFRFKYDIFALGKTFLEILSVISKKLSLMEYDYNFAYLHLLACRMLDGYNLNENDYKRKRDNGFPVYKEHWGDLNEKDFPYLKYKQKEKKKIIEQIIIDLKKLIYRDLYLNEIPELSNDYPNRIRISLYCSAPFSPRIKHIVEHPVFSRLAEEHQLTLIDTIYPTATHSRLEHSIGVFYNCCLYVRSLYNDPYNPIFKQLINVHEIKTLLLASLLHDLGQYPFAHSFEELGVFKSQLSHKKLTKAFLKNTSVDNNKSTLRKYLKSEWGIRLYEIKRLLSRAEIPDDKFSRNLKLDLLSSIIDGTIDIDKLDYYQRDTHNCNLSYGLMIDSPRLIRNLTVIIDKDRVSNNNTFAIGVYRRAQAAAETLAFTRYLLYQSVYWHHTARSFISMLKIVLKSLNDSVEDFIEKFKKFLSVSKESKRINSLQVLEFIKKCIKESNHKDQKNLKDLIDMVKNRNYYKRIFTIQYEDCLPSGAETFLAEFRRKKDRDKPSFQTTLRDEIITKFKNKYTKNKRAEIISNLQYIKTLERLEQKSSIICDYVKPKSEDQKLTIIPEPKYLYQKEKNIKKHDSEVHTQVYGRLINIVSKGRIFCHPEIRDTLMHVLTLKDIENCIKNAMNKFT